MSARGIINKLSKPQRDSLMAHADGPQPIVVSPEILTRSALIDRGLIRYVIPGGVPTARPHRTALTEIGREVLCVMLGDLADTLARNALQEPAEIKLKRPPKVTHHPRGIEAEHDLARDWKSELTGN